MWGANRRSHPVGRLRFERHRGAGQSQGSAPREASAKPRELLYTTGYLERAPKRLRPMLLKTETPNNSLPPSLAAALLLAPLPAQMWGQAVRPRAAEVATNVNQ